MSARLARFDARKFSIKAVPARIAVLASGGLDSSVMLATLARAGRSVFPVYVRAGIIWEREELRVLREFLRRVGDKRIAPLAVLELPMTDVARDHWSVTGRAIPGYRASVESNYIAGRNLSLLAKASLFCAINRIGRIAMAPLESNPFPDARPEFFRAFERAARLGLGLKLKIATPFLGLSKAQVIRRGRSMPLEWTVSCARPRAAVHCGRCTKCAERIQAFAASGVPDPTRYARPNR